MGVGFRLFEGKMRYGQTKPLANKGTPTLLDHKKHLV